MSNVLRHIHRKFGKQHCIVLGVIFCLMFLLMFPLILMLAATGTGWEAVYGLICCISILSGGILFLCASSEEYR